MRVYLKKKLLYKNVKYHLRALENDQKYAEDGAKWIIGRRKHHWSEFPPYNDSSPENYPVKLSWIETCNHGLRNQNSE